MCSKLAGCCCDTQDMNAEDECARPAPVLPLTVCCSMEQNEDGDSPGKRLVNVDAMEEMCFYTKDPCDYDYYQVCDCCGLITKWDSTSQESCPKPVKYARRQRFTFKDEKTGCLPPQPPWPFKYEALSSCPPPCAPEGTMSCCESDFCAAEGAAFEGLPCQSGVYYYNRTENKLVLQTSDDVITAPPFTQQGCCQEEQVEDDGGWDEPRIIQPLIMPNGGPCFAQSCNTCPAPGPCCSPCGGPCCGSCCPPCCSGPSCPPCGGPCCCGPSCPPCGGPCCPPPLLCPPSCCYPSPWCWNPCWSPPVNCCALPPYSNPYCGPHHCCYPCPAVRNNVCCPPPRPPPAAQTTVIPLCIPINPPAACGGCKKDYKETVIDLKRKCCC